MINPVSILAIAFLATVLALMYYTWVADGYTAPHNLAHAVIRNLKTLFAYFVGAVAINIFYDGLNWRDWEVGLFVGFALAVGIKLAVDIVALARDQKAEVE